MKTENLTVGLVVKNYKKMCEVIEEDIIITGGSSKKAQLKDWERYFTYHKEGQKFIIDEIYKEVKPVIDNRKGNSGKSEGSRSNNTVDYTQNIETLILNLLSQSKQGYGKVFLPKNSLLKELNMVNGNYSFCKQRIPKLSKFLDIDRTTVEEWYDSVSGTLERNLETALKSLEKQCLILWSREITIVKVVPISDITPEGNIIMTKKINEFDEEVRNYRQDDGVILSHREGDDEEKKFIIHTEREILKELKCRNKAIVIRLGMWETFLEKVNKIVLDKLNIAYYYKSYKILFNEDHIYEVVEDLCDFEMDKEERKIQQAMLNKSVNDRIHENVIKRQEEARKKAKVKFGITNDVKLLRRIAKRYIEDSDKLNSNFIEIDAKDIRKIVQKVKLK